MSYAVCWMLRQVLLRGRAPSFFSSGLLCATFGRSSGTQAPQLPLACDFTLVIHHQIHSLAK